MIFGNLYRPDKNSNILEFRDTLKNIFDIIKNDPNLRKAKYVQLVGDTNIDLLKYCDNNQVKTFVDTLMSNNQLPTITYRTRIDANKKTASLIDQITTSQLDCQYDAGILINSLSDHFATFHIEKEKLINTQNKTKHIRKVNDNTIATFEKIINQSNIQTILQIANAKIAFDKKNGHHK